MIAHRRTARRGLHLAVGMGLMAGLLITPGVAAAKDSATNSHTTAARVGLVDPRRDGVARTPTGDSRFGVPSASGGRSAGLQSLRRPGATVPVRYNLPRWLPQRADRTTTGSKAKTIARPASQYAGGVPLATASTPFAAPTNTSLRSNFGDYGLGDADDSLLYQDCSFFELCEEPPDPGVAVSATSIVQSVNELMLIIDRATNGSTVIPNFAFFSLDNNQVAQSDPRVLYDRGRGRWVATEISSDCGHGYLHMAVTAGDDPFGIWTVYRVVFPGRIVDFPGVGTSNDTVVVSLNAYGADPNSKDCLAPGEFLGGELVVVDWKDLEATVASLPVTTTPPDATLFTWRPATSAGGDPLTRLVVAIDNGTDETSDVGYATLSGTNAASNVTLSPVINLTKEQGLAPFETPPAPHQPGHPPTIVHAVDGQPTDAISAIGHLWFIATAPCKPTGDDSIRDCVRLSELVTGATSTNVAVASDILFGDKGRDLFMGGVGRALYGTLYVTYSRSSSTDQIAGWATWRRQEEDVFHEPVLLVPAGGIYSGERWGDYVILAPDPSTPDAIWQSSEVSTIDGTWFTWLSQLRPAPVGPFLGGAVRINGGDEFVGETVVDLHLTNPPDVALTLVRVANSPTLRDGVLAGGETLPVSSDLLWSLAIDQPKNGPPDGTRHVYVQWSDGLGHWSGTVSDSIVLDKAGPSIGAVQAPHILAGTLGPSGILPVEIRWGAGRDSSSGLEGYDIQIRRNNADWEDFGKGETPGTVATGDVTVGSRAQWRVRSFDRLGNISDWVEGPSVRIDALDDTSASIHYGSGWRRAVGPSAFRGGVHSAASAGAAGTFTFTGREFAVVGTVAAGRGTIDVIVDGGHVGRFAEAAPRTGVRRIGFARTLTPGRHTVRLVAADGRRVDLDAVILIR